MIHCTANELRYTDWHADGHKRHADGQRQVYCLKCRLWVWPDQVAFEHKEHTRTAKEFDQIVKRAMEKQQ